MELFGFEIRKRNEPAPVESFAPKALEDGAMVVQAGGVYGTYIDLDGAIRTETELVNKYREMAQHPELDSAIDDIVNEVIITSPGDKIVTLVLDDLEQPDKIKKRMVEEFNEVLELLEFQQLAYEVFKRWYVDGRLYYHAIIDKANPREGIKELRYVDPRKIRKVRETKTKKEKGFNLPQDGQEYYIYNDKGFVKTVPTQGYTAQNTGLRIAKDSIVYCPSGLMNPHGDLVQSYLHKAIKPLNQLRSLEDSLVIYRISRAPERRIFYIDVGNLPKIKAEQYLRDIMTKFKNKVVYDSSTGEVRDDRKFMTMLEDFWLPRREGGKGTEITTLPGGQNLGQMDDVTYFQQKLLKSLNVPVGRLQPEATYSIGRATEITRDEIKFAKFCGRLRLKFSSLFTKILEKQLILKGVVSSEEWPTFAAAIRYQFAADNYHAELKETEILRDRISVLRDIDDYIGRFYSNDWVRKNVLRQQDEEIQKIDKEMETEKQALPDAPEGSEDINKPNDQQTQPRR